MSHATDALNADMRNLLARMACLSYGTTQSWNTSGGGGAGDEDREPRPPGGGYTLHEKWAAKYNQATDDAGRADVLARAREDLEDHLGHAVRDRPAGETREQETERQAERVRELYRGGIWTTADIATDVHLTIGQVKRIIASAELAGSTAARDEPRAIEMFHSGNFTLRQIESITNVPKDTVKRLAKRAA